MSVGLADRLAIEAREDAWLAPYAMRVADSRGREHPCGEDPTRTAYQRDRDRIIHARAFRRLAYKTQVFLNDAGDLFRTRLTHTLEVVQLARSAARRLRLNEDLVECIALVHDLGHPPFGHRGEATLNALLTDEGGFEHNTHTLRLVEELESRYPDYPGLNLTYEVRESIVKHGGDPARVPERFAPAEAPLLEACLVDCVDSVAYDCHDLDDGLRAGILRLEDMTDLPLWGPAWRRARSETSAAADAKRQVDRCLRLLIDGLMQDLVEESARRLEAAAIRDVADLRSCRSTCIANSPAIATAKETLETWLFIHLYRDDRVNRTFLEAADILRRLYATYLAGPELLPPEHQDRIGTIGLTRVVADYLAGMTDRFASEEHVRLSAGRP